VCRLCWRQASSLRQRHQPLDYVGANHEGQQLFLGDMFLRRDTFAPRRSTSQPLSGRESAPLAAPSLVLPVGYRQLAL
jgi:hypothetical protein